VYVHAGLFSYIEYTYVYHSILMWPHVPCCSCVLLLIIPARYLTSGLPQPSLGRHLQCYVAAKVHSNQAAYSGAMSAILTGLEQHKHVQPEIAVFCRVSVSVYAVCFGL
jgi:hypothetical protein